MILLDYRSHNSFRDLIAPVRLVNDVRESKYALPEKIKKGPPTNKKISVRNMKAQITNMSAADNNGFKSEYHVKFFSYFFLFILFKFLNKILSIEKNV